MTLTEFLTKHNACAGAVAWAAKQPDLETAWRKCTRIGWMCWLAGRVIDERTMRHLACDFAETAWPFAGEGDALLQCMFTVEIARGYADGTEDEETRSAAYYSANSAASSAANSAANSAAYYSASSSASSAACFVACSAACFVACSAASSAASSAAYYAANRRNIRIMRKRIPAAMICKATGVK